MAIQVYSKGNPREAVDLVRTAQDATARNATPRVKSMLHARAARALSKTGEHTACQRELDAARTEYSRGPHDDDPPWSYWLNEGVMRSVKLSSPAVSQGTGIRGLQLWRGYEEQVSRYGREGMNDAHASLPSPPPIRVHASLTGLSRMLAGPWTAAASNTPSTATADPGDNPATGPPRWVWSLG